MPEVREAREPDDEQDDVREAEDHVRLPSPRLERRDRHRNRSKKSTISAVLSSAARRACVLWASKMNGRKSTVMAAMGNRTGESAIVGEKSEPPFEVLSSTLVSAAPRPRFHTDIQESARFQAERHSKEEHENDSYSFENGSKLSVLTPTLRTTSATTNAMAMNAATCGRTRDASQRLTAAIAAPPNDQRTNNRAMTYVAIPMVNIIHASLPMLEGQNTSEGKKKRG